MAELATDNFNRANTSTLGANWTNVATGGSDFVVFSNAAGSASVGSDIQEFYNGVTWPNDQYSQATVSATTANGADGAGNGLSLRLASGSKTFYRMVVGSTGYELCYFNTGYNPIVSAGTTTFANGDVLYGEIVGSNYTFKKNGTTFLTGSNAAITSGNAGIAYSSVTSGDGFLDNWSGGNFALALMGQACL